MRYLILVALNLPIVLLAFTNLVTKYKTGRIGRRRFYRQIILWIGLAIVLVGSFPVYNILSGNTPFESSSLSLFDIVEITAIVFLVYTVNSLRQRLSSTEKYVSSLHRTLSIKMSQEENKKN